VGWNGPIRDFGRKIRNPSTPVTKIIGTFALMENPAENQYEAERVSKQ
jgi:hypothetical protein